VTSQEQIDRPCAAPPWRMCLAVMLLALLVRAFLCSQLACISRDGVHFVTFAKQLADDPIAAMKANTKQPGFAGLLLGTHRLVGPLLGGDAPLSWERCGQLLALLGGVAVCGLIYALARRLFDRTVAAVAGILAAFWWQGAQLSADVLSDMPHLALYLAAWLIAHQALSTSLPNGPTSEIPTHVGMPRSGELPRIALCGVVAGLAYLLRQEAIGLPAAIGLCALWPRPGVPLRRRLVAVALLAGCFAAVIVPHALAVGKIMPNKSLHDLLFGWPRVSQAAGWLPSPVLAGVMPWWEAPLGMLEAWAKSGRYVISTLVLIGVLWRPAPEAERTGRRLILAAVIVQILLVQLRVAIYGEISSRYLVIPAALAIPWAASGLVALLNAAIGRLRSSGNAARFLVLTAGCVLPLAPQVYYFLRPANYAGRYLRDAGAWLAADSKREEIVLAHERLEQMMFYADRTYPRDGAWLRIPRSATADDLCGLLDRSRPAWFIDAEVYRPLPAGGAVTRPAPTQQMECGTAALGCGFDGASFLEAIERRAQVSLLPTWVVGPPGKRVCLVRVRR
jgi:hypothetical protein